MLLLHSINTGNTSYLDSKIKAFWDYSKSTILSINADQFNDEDYKGKSFNQWKSMTYFYLLALLTTIQNDILLTGQTWSFYYTKYNLANIKTCLNCIGIKLDNYLVIFGFPLVTIESVGGLGIQEGLELDPETIDPPVVITIDLMSLLATPNYCTNLIN